MNMLIHADWLEEQGMSDRANFIRSCVDDDESMTNTYNRQWSNNRSGSSSGPYPRFRITCSSTYGFRSMSSSEGGCGSVSWSGLSHSSNFNG